MARTPARSGLVGLAEFSATLARRRASVAEANLVAAAEAGALPIQNAAKEKARRRSGTLSRSIHTEVIEQSPTRVVVAIGTDLEYAAIHEFGGTIVPKNGQYLKFPGLDGEDVFVKEVTIRAQPYLRPAYDERKAEAVAEMKAALRALIRAALR